MEFDYIILKKEDGIATLTLNRPDRMNAFDPHMVNEMVAAIENVAGDDEVRVLVITGAGRGFCAGGDVKTMRGGGGEQARPEGISPEEIRRSFRRGGHRVILGLQRMEKPTIAMINGPAVGGGLDIASACDIRVGCENSKLHTGYIRIGSFPGWGGTWLLPRIVGIPKACEILFAGNTIEAEEAEKMGLLNKVVPSDQLQQETMGLARQIAGHAPIGIRLTKLMIYKGLEIDLETSLEFAAAGESITLSSEDHKEAVMAFREKRRGAFKGR